LLPCFLARQPGAGARGRAHKRRRRLRSSHRGSASPPDARLGRRTGPAMALTAFPGGRWRRAPRAGSRLRPLTIRAGATVWSGGRRLGADPDAGPNARIGRFASVPRTMWRTGGRGGRLKRRPHQLGCARSACRRHGGGGLGRRGAHGPARLGDRFRETARRLPQTQTRETALGASAWTRSPKGPSRLPLVVPTCVDLGLEAVAAGVQGLSGGERGTKRRAENERARRDFDARSSAMSRSTVRPRRVPARPPRAPPPRRPVHRARRRPINRIPAAAASPACVPRPSAHAARIGETLWRARRP
jgi:hypothetical protein